jgi:Polyketide cyclase / dehydrase and lipid transport
VNAAFEYHFVTRWRIEGTCGEVADVLGDPAALARWWPSVYLDVVELAPAGPQGVGRRVSLVTKGWLPYTLKWDLVVVESRYPHGFTIDASGDFNGRGIWTFEQRGRFVDVTYDWRIRADKPLIRQWSFAFKPLFEGNHRWAMRQGEESLALELARRRATSDAARRAVPPPPGPVTLAGVGLLAAGAASGIGLMYLLWRTFRR